MATCSIAQVSKAIMYVTNINQNSKDICFEGKILNRYGTLDYICFGSNRGSSSCKFPYLHHTIVTW